VGNLKSLEARLAHLEARVAAIPDPKEQEARDERWILHTDTWLLEGSFEDIPEKDREPTMWETLSRYGPSYLGLVWEEILPGREEYLASGVDFTRARGCEDFVGGRPYGAPGPDTPRKL
jgi:hypothetical protein